MKRKKLDASYPNEQQIPIATKIGLCLWMSAIMILFLILFFPSEHLNISGQSDFYNWVLHLQGWLRPIFEDPISKYFPP
jgi:hypothetical protein